MSLVRKIGEEIRRGDSTAQDVTKSYIEKVGIGMWMLSRNLQLRDEKKILKCRANKKQVLLSQIHASDEMVGSFISVTADLAMEQVFFFVQTSWQASLVFQLLN